MAEFSQDRARRRLSRNAGLIGLALAVLIVAVPGDLLAAARSASITVSSAISLKDALDEIAQGYERSHPGSKILLNYGGSGTLQHQIEQGAPVDIFVSAGEEEMDTLESEGLVIAATRHNLVSNELVLIVPRNSKSVQDFKDLERPDVKVIALGDPATVPAGMYARQTLDHMGLFAAVQKKVVFAKDVRQVLAYVETGNADAGIVYQTDARITSDVRIVAKASPAFHQTIVYPAAILKGSRDIAAARSFLEFLTGQGSQAILERFGFTAPEKRAEKS